MPKHRHNSIASNRARSAVLTFLELAKQPDSLLERISDVLPELERQPEDVLAALADHLEENDARMRVFAAWLLVTIAARGPSLVPSRRTLAKAASVVVQCLGSGTPDARLLSCILLSQGNPPNQAVPILLRFIKESDERLQVFSAAALCTTDSVNAGVIEILGKALRHGDPAIVAAAAAAFGRLQVRLDQAVDKLITALCRVTCDSQLSILMALKQIGPQACKAVPVMMAYLRDTGNPDYLRGTAATVLGSICREDGSGKETLVEALAWGNPDIIVGASQGLALTERVPSTAVNRLASLLSDADAEVRIAAASGLREFGPRAAAALPSLISRIGLESSPRMTQVLAEALAGIGNQAVSPLIELVKQRDMQKLPVIASAFREMGEAGAAELVEPLMREHDEGTRGILLLILRDMGARAAPAAPVLARLL